MAALLTIGAALIAAWLLARLLRPAGLPPVVGMVIGGALVGNTLGLSLGSMGLAVDGLATDDVARPVRLAVLAVVLLRAGLALSMQDLRRGGPLALRLGIVPLLCDAAAVACGGVLLLGLAWPVALVLGFTVAAISPAIVIPGLLELLGRARRSDRPVVKAALTGAPLDNISAVLLLGLALSLALGDGGGVSATLSAAGLEIGGGLAAGLAAGELGAWLLGKLKPSHRTALLAWLLAGGVVAAGEMLGFSSVLAVIVAGMVLRSRNRRIRKALEEGLGRIWAVVQVALFGLIGLAVELGPLRDVGLLLVVVIVLGQLARGGGSWLATTGAALPTRQRLACAAAYVPKATIQAAFGSLALDRGLPEGGVILTAAVLSIVLCAPVGAVALQRAGRWAFESSR